jgi:hypothetical protein
MTLAKPLYSKVEVCDLFDRTPEGLDYLKKKGLIPQPVKIGRREFWKAEDLVAFIEGLK